MQWQKTIQASSAAICTNISHSLCLSVCVFKMSLLSFVACQHTQTVL